MKKTTKPVEIKKVARVRDKATGDYFEVIEFRLIEQGLSRPFIELPCDDTELGLTMQGQISVTWKILAQQSVGVFVGSALPGRQK